MRGGIITCHELTLGELEARIEQIRTFDPAAPARHLSVLYHTRWALSVAPSIVALFALAIARRERRKMLDGAIAVLSSSAFALLLSWANYLAFRGSISPPLGAWLANFTFLGLTAAVMLGSTARRASGAR